MKLGVSSFAYGWAVGVRGSKPESPLDEHGLLDRAKELGVHLVQFGDNLPVASFDQERRLRLNRKLLEESVQVEIGGRGLTVENLAQHIEVAREFHASILRFVIDEGSYEPSPQQVVRVLQEVAPLLDVGPILAIENHDRFPAQVLQEVVESVNSNRVGVCLDTANSLGAGEGLEQVARVLAPFVVNLHIKDFRIARVEHQMGFEVTGCPAGQGMMNLTRVLEILAPFSRCKSAILEQWTPPQKSVEETIALEKEWAQQSIDYLRPLLEH